VAGLEACEPRGVRATAPLVFGRERFVGIDAVGAGTGVAQLDTGVEPRSLLRIASGEHWGLCSPASAECTGSAKREQNGK
jgi:hypothetical protein